MSKQLEGQMSIEDIGVNVMAKKKQNTLMKRIERDLESAHLRLLFAVEEAQKQGLDEETVQKRVRACGLAASALKEIRESEGNDER